MKPEVIASFFSCEFEKEEASGFKRLGRVPDTRVKKFLDYFRSLRKRDADVLKLAISKRASMHYCVSIGFSPQALQAQLGSEETRAWDKLLSELALMGDWKYLSLKLLKMAAGMRRSDNPEVRRQADGFYMPDDVLSWVDGLIACKATELRKLVKLAFHSRFGLAPRNLGGGYWLYSRTDEAGGFNVDVDYGGIVGQQLRYSVNLRDSQTQRQAGGLRFELLLGAGIGDWDFITEGTVDQDVALLTDLVGYTASIPDRLEAFASSGE